MTLSTISNTAASLSLTTGYEVALAPGTNQVLTDLEGWFSGPAVRRPDTARLWAHGSFSERGFREARLITVHGHAFAETRREAANLTDSLAAVLADGTKGVFRVNDADLGSRWASVYLVDTPDIVWDGLLDVTYSIDLLAPDPRKYADASTATTTAAAPGGGLVFDLFQGVVGDGPGQASTGQPGVLDFGASSHPGKLTFANAGTADTAPVFTVAGYAPGFTITEVATGARLVYEDEVLEGQTLRLDASDGSVLLDGYADRGYALTRREWSRVPGSGSSTYLFESFGNRNATMTLEVKSAWW